MNQMAYYMLMGSIFFIDGGNAPKTIAEANMIEKRIEAIAKQRTDSTRVAVEVRFDKKLEVFEAIVHEKK